MLISDAHGNLVTAANAGSVELLDRTVSAYLGFRKDTGDRLKETLAADPDLMMAHCLRGYFMMLFGQRAMVPRDRLIRREKPRRQGSHSARRLIWRRLQPGSPAI